MELLNDRIKEFNNGFMIPMDRKENLKNFLMDNLLVVKEAEQPIELKRIDINNGNNYAKLIKQKFPEKYSQICLINYSGIVKNLQTKPIEKEIRMPAPAISKKISNNDEMNF
ncbi:hypothetical protein [uncultured Campylobacter sp.]|uniref:hypothetical protein n=1 Tax=uncultured Campylobacter sp. TaxID=218934 RepID=UPI0025EB6888|nr:hypothetical protein [uncultured Campylobacter sp.]